MPFFSKLKKAKEAAAEHKKEASKEEEKKPKVPYKHVPTHAGIDALAATPSSMGNSELRERIAAARRSRSVSSASAPAHRSGTSLYHGQAGGSSSRSRPASVISTSNHSRNGSLGRRTNSDLSISTMMQSHQEKPSRGRQPVRNDYFSHASGVPAVPQLPPQHRPKTQNTVSSRSSVAKRRSPLSAMSITEDDAGEASGEASASSAEHSDASVASSQSSATEISRPNSSQEHNKDMTKDISKENNYSRPLSTIVSAASTPMETLQQKKHQSVIEVAPKSELMKKKSMKQRFSLFNRKSMAVAAH